MKSFLYIFVVIFGGILIDTITGDVKVLDGDDPGQCDKSNHAEQVLVRDRENNEKVLICSDNDGVYQWETIDGSTRPGEFFSPSYDCSDILDKDMEAKDGFYWVQFDSYTPRKVWCDMTTDGGGFMLIGHKNNSVTWSVPSNDNPVDPLGFPHWSSAVGDAPILDFRVQMSTGSDLKQTKSHWSFRLNNLRPLRNLMIMGEKGCDGDSPGIGDIAYVKDLQTEEIVATNFRCSKFGIAYHAQTKIGWSMMNACLQKPCPWGFAYHHKYNIQLDRSGAFSYSATGKVSGIVQNATAFIGCSKGQCCGCYGPVGGKQDYCSKKCQPLNGGTVTKNVYTWFWVRSALPKRVWNKCMEYKVTKTNGDVVWYKLVGGNVNPTEGRCNKKEVRLNDGIVVVPDAKTAKMIPSVAGLMAYRKDSKEVYVRSNETWKVIAQEEKVMQETSKMVKPKLKEFEERLQDQNQQVMQLLDANFAHINKTLENELGNQSKIQTEQLLSFRLMLNHLEKQLENVNKTLRSLHFDDELPSSISLNKGQSYLSQLKQWLPIKSSWKLCYRATRDGWESITFHSQCDYRGPTVSIVRVGSYVFGAYTEIPWGGTIAYKRSTRSFMFSLKNRENRQPFQSSLYDKNYAIYNKYIYGPTFGDGHDLYIANNANLNTNSYTQFGGAYRLPSGCSYDASNTKALLAGSYNFSPSEVEVFYLR